MLCKKEWDIVSKAFLKSMSSIRAFFCFSVTCLIRLIRLIMTDPILLFVMYAFCWRPINRVMAALIILRFVTRSYSLKHFKHQH